ncbi:MAG: class I SAM-dependent methyltransferase [Planctomycetes bacterium]|nr:class I SAM-dependent methyltransferase [Planctomycetota bacterium]
MANDRPPRQSPAADDPYSRVDYRRVIAWPERVRREAPFLFRVLAGAPARSVADLGCGTGEHCRFLAGEGFRVAGLDSSESMLERARDGPLPPDLRFALGDIREAEQALGGPFGAAICLGNTLVHLVEPDDLRRALQSVRAILEPAGHFLFQILNYDRIFAQKARYLPLNFRPAPADDGEVVFLRLLEPLEGGRVRFCPSTLLYDPAADPPLKVVSSRIVDLRGWRLGELAPLLEEGGLEVAEVHGDMEGGPFDAASSQDLVVVARRRVGPPAR